MNEKVIEHTSARQGGFVILGGRGYPNRSTDKLRECDSDKGGGVKKSGNFVDII